MDKSPKEPDRVNKLDTEAVHSAVRSIFDKRHSLNGPVHCHDGTNFFWHSRMFLYDHRLQSIRKWYAVLSSDGFPLLKIVNEGDSFRVPENWHHRLTSKWNAFCLFQSRFHSTSPLVSMLFHFRRIIVDPYFVDCYKKPQKKRWVLFKQLQIFGILTWYFVFALEWANVTPIVQTVSLCQLRFLRPLLTHALLLSCRIKWYRELCQCFLASRLILEIQDVVRL